MIGRPISLLVYVAMNNRCAHFREFIRKQMRYGDAEVIYTIDELCRRVRQNCKRDVIMLLLITSRVDLEQIAQHAELLCDHKIVLVLQDRSPVNIAIGHSLYPRYISYDDGDLRDVGWVLERMLERDKSEFCGDKYQYTEMNPKRRN